MNPRPDGQRSGGVARGRIGALAARVIREPLVHFLIIGVVIFLTANTLKGLQRPVLRIDEDELKQLTAYWQLQMQRPPSPEELRGLVRERIDEEILANEALRRGLDKDDIIIRRRLAQKMAFASEDVAQVADPDDAVLKAYYQRNAAQYAVPAHLAFRQVYFSAERGDTQARLAAEAALARLKGGEADISGDPLVLPLTYADVGLPDLIRDYGDQFARFVQTSPVGVWAGPTRSAYGWHLVRVDSRAAVSQPPFAEVRPQVRDAWFQDQRRRANAALMDRLRARYRIEIAAPPG